MALNAAEIQPSNQSFDQLTEKQIKLCNQEELETALDDVNAEIAKIIEESEDLKKRIRAISPFPSETASVIEMFKERIQLERRLSELDGYRQKIKTTWRKMEGLEKAS